MDQILQTMLGKIATTTGFIFFVAIITFGYLGIWLLFLYEPKPKLKKAAPQKAAEGAKEGKEARPGTGRLIFFSILIVQPGSNCNRSGLFYYQPSSGYSGYFFAIAATSSRTDT